LQQLLLLSRQRVQTRRDDALHRFRQLSGRSAFRQHAHVLLCEQRVPTRALEQRSLVVGELNRLLQQCCEQPCGVFFGEGL
jgi:hypothetical protein